MFMCLVQIEQMAVFSTIPLLYTRLCNMYVLVCRSEYCNICTYKWWGHLIDLYLRLMRSSDRFVLTNDDATWSTCTCIWWGHLMDLYLRMMRSSDRFVELYLRMMRSSDRFVLANKWWGHLIDLYLRKMRSPDQFVLTNDEVTLSICTYKWWGHLINLDQSDVWLCMVIQLICRSIICLTPFRKRIDLDQADGWTNHHSWAQLAKKGTSVIR